MFELPSMATLFQVAITTIPVAILAYLGFVVFPAILRALKEQGQSFARILAHQEQAEAQRAQALGCTLGELTTAIQALGSAHKVRSPRAKAHEHNGDQIDLA